MLIEITDPHEQVEDVKRTIKYAIDAKESRISNVKAPMNVPGNTTIDFGWCTTFVDFFGFLGFAPTKRSYQRECPCCGTLVDV